ncbi:SDR family oxidoreductase [Mesorhizobium sp. CO1-1-8]|uniref:SDR family oxidoreductase n=1 Tax=Mesorhizobium sp. CO1-1-8 TaxID=2876631 RepID=UPI001CD10A39|nr:SDR family oxidoreductase [Mesorhizobium sp. CO1-1-8]MBZ9772400.1 SDR family oxidoreductase [Mesorhizobium sp. CO1-1-8]
MAKTILITGSSSGIGRATATLFQERGWNVIATMRSPEKETRLGELENVFITHLDVTDVASIELAVKAGIDRFQKIDVLLNNAGFGAYGPLEATPLENIRREFDTNVLGGLATTKAVLPHFRANKQGVIVNISSIGGRFAYPFGALYHGSKFAVEGASEALSYEASAIGVRVKIVEPGMVATGFGAALDFSNDESLTEYQDAIGKLMTGFEKAQKSASPPEAVAEVVYEAATDGTDRLRYAVGADAKTVLAARKSQDDATFLRGIRDQFRL